MSSARIYIGHLSSRASERDVEHFFRGYGRIRDIVLKDGFGFIEFEETRDAEDAVYELNGKDLCGDRVIVEFSRARGSDRGRDRDRGRDYNDRDRYGGRGGGDRYGGQRNSRYGPPTQTRHRLTVENLSSRISWQDLKDTLRKAGCEVTYADAHKVRKNEAVVCFASRSDLQLAIEKFDDKDMNGRRLKLTDASEGSRSRTRSRSRSRSGRRSRSRSARRSRSRSSSRSQSRERSASPKKRKSKSRSESRSRSRSRDRSNGRDKSRSRSGSADKGSEKANGNSPAKNGDRSDED